MIYGDKQYEDGEIRIPDYTAIAQSGNLYVYCMNDPVNGVDPWGTVDRYLTDLVSETTGQVWWDPLINAAVVEIDGMMRYYSIYDYKTVNDKIVVDDQSFYYEFNIVGTISIVAYWNEYEEMQVSSAETNMVSGHSLIRYRALNGSIDSTYATWGWGEYGEGVYYNRIDDKNLLYDYNSATYSKKITQNQFNRMYDEVRSPDNDTWGYFNTCTNFAERVFYSATGIYGKFKFA